MCQVCSKGFKRKEHLNLHAVIHSGLKTEVNFKLILNFKVNSNYFIFKEMHGMWEGFLSKGSSTKAHKVSSIEASKGGG